MVIFRHTALLKIQQETFAKPLDADAVQGIAADADISHIRLSERRNAPQTVFCKDPGPSEILHCSKKSNSPNPPKCSLKLKKPSPAAYRTRLEKPPEKAFMVIRNKKAVRLSDGLKMLLKPGLIRQTGVAAKWFPHGRGRWKRWRWARRTLLRCVSDKPAHWPAIG